MQNLLFLAHRIPYPPNKGDKIRSYHLLEYLATRYHIYLGTFIDDPQDWQYTGVLDAICAETCYLNLNPLFSKIKSAQGFLTQEALSLPYYKNNAMQAWVDNTLQKHAISKVLIFSSVMAQFIHETDTVEMLVDFVDVDSDKWRQYAEKKQGLAKWVYQRESTYLLKYEQAIAEKSKMSFFVSEQEAALFKTLAPTVKEKITHINNGVDTEYFSPDQNLPSPFQSDERTLVFTGAMDYWANVDAVKWFAESVFPQILLQHPTLKFYIVGSKPTKDVTALTLNPNIIVTGAVDDVRPYTLHATLVVAPLRIARGIQNKVLEAMALGKHVVATTPAMEGITYDLSTALTVADDETGVANQTIALLNKNSILDSANNRGFVKAHFGWEQSLNKLFELLA